ncbi:hypothetical protein D3C78_909420 [compost metagenome]
MGRLRARRHILAVGHRAGGAVAEHEDVLVAARLQGRQYHQLIDPVGFQAVQLAEEVGGANAGGPDLEAGRNEVAVGGAQALGGDFLDRRADQDLDAQLLQGAVYRAADAFGQGGDHPRAGLDQGQVEVFRADAVETVGRQQ